MFMVIVSNNGKTTVNFSNVFVIKIDSLSILAISSALPNVHCTLGTYSDEETVKRVYSNLINVISEGSSSIVYVSDLEKDV